MSDSESSLMHFEAIVGLAQRIKKLDLAVYEHHYYSLVFGSWTIVAGRRKERVKITWDGRDGYLNFSGAVFPNSSYSPKPNDWIQKENISIDLKETTLVYQKVEQYLLQTYNI